MKRTKKTDLALLAALQEDQLLLNEKGSLNGTSDQARARLADATALGLDLSKAALEPLQKYLSEQPDHSIDQEQVSMFASLLGRKPEAFLTRAFAHKNNPNKETITARQGTLDPKNFSDPEQWQREGRGLYVVINEGSNTADSITSCPANFFELDNLPKAEQLDQIDSISELKDLIGMMVATRDGDAGSLHTYFLLKEPVTDVWRWRLMQWRLIQLYKSDSKVEDPSRVMRLPGAWYVMGDGSFHSRSQIVDDRTTGKRLTFEELEKAVAEAEEKRNLSPVDAVPKARWREEAVKEMMGRLFPEEVKKQAPEKKASLAETLQKFQASSYPKRTLEEIKAALAVMPPRISGRNTYEECRLVFGGLAGALESIELEPGHAIALIEEAGWEGWNSEQILDSSTVWSEGYFWNHAKKCGFDSDKWKKERQQKKDKENAEQFRSDLQDLFESDLGGCDLTFALMELGKRCSQQFHSVRKAYDELTQNEKGIDRMGEALDIIKTSQSEKPISVRELVPERFYTDVIQDFQKGFVIDDLLVLMLVLTAMSSVLPLGTKVRLLDDTEWDQAMLLFFMGIAVSGSKKTALFKQLISSPIQKSGIKERAKQKLYQIKNLEAIALKNKKVQDESMSSELLDKLKNQVPITPFNHVVHGFTGEGIDRGCQQAEAHYRHGFLVGTDEGRQLMSGDQYKNSGSTYTIDKLTRIYDGEGSIELRANAASERHYEVSHVAIALMIQPEIYDQIAAKQADDQSGFWPRFLAQDFPPVTTRRLSREERKACAFKKYPETLSNLFDLANQVSRANVGDHDLVGGRGSQFRFSDDAQEWFAERNQEIEERQLHENQHGDPMIGRVLGKAAGQIGRLASLLHLLHQLMNVMQDDQDRVRSEISLATVEKAYRLQAHLMSKTLKQRLRATGTGTGDDTKLLRDVQERCLAKDPEQKGLRIGAISKFWNTKNQPDKETLFQALCVLASDGYGDLTRSTANRGGFLYRALKPLPA